MAVPPLSQDTIGDAVAYLLQNLAGSDASLQMPAVAGAVLFQEITGLLRADDGDR